MKLKFSIWQLHEQVHDVYDDGKFRWSLHLWNLPQWACPCSVVVWIKTILNLNWICFNQFGFPGKRERGRHRKMLFNCFPPFEASGYNLPLVYLINWIIHKQLTQNWKPQNCLIPTRFYKHVARIHDVSLPALHRQTIAINFMVHASVTFCFTRDW